MCLYRGGTDGGFGVAALTEAGKWRGKETAAAGAEYILPDVAGATELAQALVVKAVDLCDLAALVVSADKHHPVRIAHLER